MPENKGSGGEKFLSKLGKVGYSLGIRNRNKDGRVVYEGPLGLQESTQKPGGKEKKIIGESKERRLAPWVETKSNPKGSRGNLEAKEQRSSCGFWEGVGAGERKEKAMSRKSGQEIRNGKESRLEKVSMKFPEEERDQEGGSKGISSNGVKKERCQLIERDEQPKGGENLTMWGSRKQTRERGARDDSETERKTKKSGHKLLG